MLKGQKLYLAMILTGWTVITGCGDNSAETSEVKTICGASEDFVAVNAYRGTVDFVQTREEAVGRLNRSCSGTFIGTVGSNANLFITAGHCGNKGEAASVEFNFEADADGPVKTVKGKFIESSSSPDYALIQLDANPGLAATPIGKVASKDLTIIQHPAARPKVVAFGTLSGNANGSRISYSSLDTLGGSSGSGILNAAGELVGVHTLGGCSSTGGNNSGWTISGIRAASSIL